MTVAPFSLCPGASCPVLPAGGILCTVAFVILVLSQVNVTWHMHLTFGPTPLDSISEGRAEWWLFSLEVLGLSR